MPGALRRGGDEHLRAGDQLEAAGMVLANPRLVIIQLVEMLEQFEIALDRERRVLVVIVKRREKNAAAQIEIVHAEVLRRNAPTLTLPRMRGRVRVGAVIVGHRPICRKLISPSFAFLLSWLPLP